MSESIHTRPSFGHKAMRRIWNLANLPAFIALLVIFCALLYAESVNRTIHRHSERAEIQSRANLVASKLQGLVSSNVELVRGFASTIATEPWINQSRFAELAESLFHEKMQLKNIAGAPDLVISLMYPMKGNEKAIGLDYRRNKEQKALALYARDSGKTTLAGPVNLVQGGTGLIARYPIYYAHPTGGPEFWGILSAVIDIETIYESSGLTANSDLLFALVGKDGKGADGLRFFGPIEAEQNDPVKVSVDFGIGQWELRAIPASGWQTVPSNVWTIRGIALVAMLMVALPFAFVGWLTRERVETLRANIEGQRKIAAISKRLELALETSQIGVWEFDPEAREPIWDEQMYYLYGFDKSKSISDTLWQDSLHPDDRKRVIGEVNEALNADRMYKSEFRIIPEVGEERTIRAAGAMMTNEYGKRVLVGVNWDITEDVAREKALSDARAESDRRYYELEIAKARIEANALHDFLTGLPNRRYLDQQLHHEQEGSLIQPSTALLKIDLDGFKEVNDTYGHAAGDAMLTEVANLLRSLTEGAEFAARVGGDEFIILCRNVVEEDRPAELASTIIEQIQKPIEFKGRHCKLGASIGITYGRDALGDPDKLLSNADLALYQSKQNGKGRFNFFSKPLYERARKQRRLADDLLRGIENRELIAYYQGQYCAHTQELKGAEALVRWNHPERGLLAPFEFMDAAESLGVIAAIDELVLDRALSDQKAWSRGGLDVPKISVNVSARRLGERDLISNLKKMQFDPERLTFELVESTFLDRSEKQVAANIRQIRDMGIDIEIDDFGTAYASIVSLTHLLPNRLKIDRELIKPVIESADQRELVHSIIHIGRTLGIGTVAEGVETMEHAEILRIMGVDILQGYAFCRPMSCDDFLEFHLKRKSNQVA